MYKAIKLTGLPKQDAGSLMAFSLGEGSAAALFVAAAAAFNAAVCGVDRNLSALPNGRGALPLRPCVVSIEI